MNPVVSSKIDPDLAPASVVEQEMSLFNSFMRQNEALGG